MFVPEIITAVYNAKLMAMPLYMCNFMAGINKLCATLLATVKLKTE